MTKKYKVGSIITWIISFLLMFGPAVGFGIYSLCTCDVVYNKVALCMTMVIVLILSIISLVNKHMYRSRIWIIIIGIYACIDAFMPCILTIAITQVIDEILVSPLHKHFHDRYVINKEMDKRGV